MTTPSDPGQQPPASPATVERGQSIDRFVVIGLVGRGGMGEVYAAYDPELDRKVAIKLLRARGVNADGRTRLLREAQAIAKLSHPNVIVVYDVGTFGDSVFIAMEFIEGRTLSGWLHAGKRSRREIMDVFLAAGRGLAAAHAAGLVHRDFKPDNVMVTNDGQVRVMDFGLARQAGEAGAGEGEPRPAPVQPPPDLDPDETAKLGGDNEGPSWGSYLSLKLTQTGAMLGTPAYMAPEQFAVQPTDARTDQFSFCVALYELLYGQRPFEGENFLALMTNVTTGAVRAAPARTRVPGWLRKVVVRGLATEPARRYPSMNALLAALETDPTVRTRRLAAGAGLLVCLALAAVGARRVSGQHEAMCRGGAVRWAGIWEAGAAASPRKEAIRRAFVATGRSYAEKAYASAARLLDDYVAKWLAMYTDACEATHVRSQQPADVLDLRMSCLQERLTRASALSEVFAHADGKVVENGVSAAGALPLVDRCADVALLKAVIKPPDNEALRHRVEGLRAELAQLVARRDAGHCAEAERMAQGLIPRVRAAGYLPLLSETLGAAGFLANECIGLDVAEPRFEEAYTAGVASGHDEAAATASILVGGLIADRSKLVGPSRDWLSLARATLVRIGSHPRLDGWLRDSEGIVLQIEGRTDEATASHGAAGRIYEKLLGKDHPDRLTALLNMGNTLLVSGRTAESLALTVEARERLEATLGAEHPKVALVSNNEGEALNWLGRHAEARIAFQRATDIWKKSGADPMFFAYGFTGLGIALVGEGKATEAIPLLEEALRIRVAQSLDAEHLGETRFALARALWPRRADRERALALARQARADLRAPKTAADKRTATQIESWLEKPS